MAVESNTAELVIAHSDEFVGRCAVFGPTSSCFPKIHVGLVQSKLQSEYVGSAIERTTSHRVNKVIVGWKEVSHCARFAQLAEAPFD
jgi:hypothetical protein